MKYFFVLFLLITSGLGYFRYGQPQSWNTCLDSLKAPEPSKPSSDIPLASTPTADSSLAAPTSVQQAEIISSNSTNYTSEHVKDVVQPTQPPLSNNATLSAPAQSERPVPTSIPSTITTIEGTTYTNCALSRVTPDGISFMHATGAATVKFSDLDPSLATAFNYDPTAAKKYEQEQELQESASDSQRATADAREPDNVSPNLPVNSPRPSFLPTTASTLSTDQRTSIQAHIVSLQNDVAFMQEQEHKVIDNRLITDGNHVSSGAYAQKIADENAQIKQLQQELIGQ